MALTLTSKALAELSSVETRNLLNGLSNEALDGEIREALALKKDPKALHVLVMERLGRMQAASIKNKRLLMFYQVRDLHIIRDAHTYDLEGNQSFTTYVKGLCHDWIVTHGDEDAEHVLVTREWTTIETWMRIYEHFHIAHNIPLERLAMIPKSRLEVMNNLCRDWDGTHNGELDPDILQMLESSTPREDMKVKYIAMKESRGQPISEHEKKIAEKEYAGDGVEVNEPPRDRHPATRNEDDGDDQPPWKDEVEWTLNAQTGALMAWVNGARGQRSAVKCGTLIVIANSQARDLVMGLCQAKGIRVQ